MAMLTLVSIKQCGTRCVLVVVDRTDLAQQACQEFNDLLERCFKIPISKQKTEQRPEVFQVNNAMELQKYFCKMVEDPKKRLVLTVTLQSFPHLRGALPKELEETTVVMADEVHRSHADEVHFPRSFPRCWAPDPGCCCLRERRRTDVSVCLEKGKDNTSSHFTLLRKKRYLGS